MELTDLPLEILVLILSSLELRDLLNASESSCVLLTAARYLRKVVYTTKNPKNLPSPAWDGVFEIHLNLAHTPVTDVSALGHVHTLDLAGTGVTDVSALGGVHTLIR